MDHEPKGPTATRRTRALEFQEALADFSRHIDEMHEAMIDLDAYEFLGIPDDFTPQDLKIAYHRLARELRDPRFYRKVTAAVRERIDELFDYITHLYETLQHPQRRAAYDARRRIRKAIGKITREAAYQASQHFLAGQGEIKKDAWKEAAKCFRSAWECDPGNEVYSMYLGWALFQVQKKSAQKNFSQAKEFLFFSKKLNRTQKLTNRYLAEIALLEGRIHLAREYVEDALAEEPQDRALRELKAQIEVRIEAVDRERIGFDRLNAEELEIVNLHNQLRRMTYYELLEIDPDASPVEIRLAFARAIKRFHPDRHHGRIGPQILPLLDEVITRIINAHRVLSSPELRKRYDEHLKAKRTRPPSKPERSEGRR